MRPEKGMIVRRTRADTGNMRGDIHPYGLRKIPLKACDEFRLLRFGWGFIQ